jgi:hypothetical protein
MIVDSKSTVSPRVWTAEELARVWPLPDGWMWSYTDGDGQAWMAIASDEDDDAMACFIWADGTVGCDNAPPEVVLAVIGAHQGRDSVEAMAVEVEREAADHEPAGLDPTAVRWAGFGREALGRVAAMLRRGRVAP